MAAAWMRVGRFLANEDGATAIEYGLIAAMVGLGALMAMTAFGNSLTGLFDFVRHEATTAMDNAGAPAPAT